MKELEFTIEYIVNNTKELEFTIIEYIVNS